MQADSMLNRIKRLDDTRIVRIGELKKKVDIEKEKFKIKNV
jgi:hypothetical protein